MELLEREEGNLVSAREKLTGIDQITVNPSVDIVQLTSLHGSVQRMPDIVTAIGGLNILVVNSVQEARHVAQMVYDVLPNGGVFIVTGFTRGYLSAKEFREIGFEVMNMSIPQNYPRAVPRELYILRKGIRENGTAPVNGGQRSDPSPGEGGDRAAAQSLLKESLLKEGYRLEGEDEVPDMQDELSAAHSRVTTVSSVPDRPLIISVRRWRGNFSYLVHEGQLMIISGMEANEHVWTSGIYTCIVCGFRAMVAGKPIHGVIHFLSTFQATREQFMRQIVLFISMFPSGIESMEMILGYSNDDSTQNDIFARDIKDTFTAEFPFVKFILEDRYKPFGFGSFWMSSKGWVLHREYTPENGAYEYHSFVGIWGKDGIYHQVDSRNPLLVAMEERARQTSPPGTGKMLGLLIGLTFAGSLASCSSGPVAQAAQSAAWWAAHWLGLAGLAAVAVMILLKKLNKFFNRNFGVFQNSLKRPTVDFPVVRNDQSYFGFVVSYFDMAAALAYARIADLFKGLNNLAARTQRWLRAHKASLRILLFREGRGVLGLVSKYKWIASLILLIASSSVLPWLQQPLSAGQLATIYPSSPFSKTIFMLIISVLLLQSIKYITFLFRRVNLNFIGLALLAGCSSGPVAQAAQSAAGWVSPWVWIAMMIGIVIVALLTKHFLLKPIPVVQGIEELREMIAKLLGDPLRHGPIFMIIDGKRGVGKTVFARQIARAQDQRIKIFSHDEIPFDRHNPDYVEDYVLSHGGSDHKLVIIEGYGTKRIPKFGRLNIDILVKIDTNERARDENRLIRNGPQEFLLYRIGQAFGLEHTEAMRGVLVVNFLKFIIIELSELIGALGYLLKKVITVGLHQHRYAVVLNNDPAHRLPLTATVNLILSSQGEKGDGIRDPGPGVGKTLGLLLGFTFAGLLTSCSSGAVGQTAQPVAWWAMHQHGAWWAAPWVFGWPVLVWAIVLIVCILAVLRFSPRIESYRLKRGSKVMMIGLVPVMIGAMAFFVPWWLRVAASISGAVIFILGVEIILDWNFSGIYSLYRFLLSRARYPIGQRMNGYILRSFRPHTILCVHLDRKLKSKDAENVQHHVIRFLLSALSDLLILAESIHGKSLGHVDVLRMKHDLFANRKLRKITGSLGFIVGEEESKKWAPMHLRVIDRIFPRPVAYITADRFLEAIPVLREMIKTYRLRLEKKKKKGTACYETRPASITKRGERDPASGAAGMNVVRGLPFDNKGIIRLADPAVDLQELDIPQEKGSHRTDPKNAGMWVSLFVITLCVISGVIAIKNIFFAGMFFSATLIISGVVLALMSNRAIKQREAANERLEAEILAHDRRDEMRLVSPGPSEDPDEEKPQDHPITPQAMFEAARRARSEHLYEPYIARGFEKLGWIYLRAAVYLDMEKRGPPPSPEQIEEVIKNAVPKELARLKRIPIATYRSWKNKSTRLRLKKILNNDWAYYHLNLHEKTFKHDYAIKKQRRSLQSEYRAGLSDFITLATGWNLDIIRLNYARTKLRDQDEDQSPVIGQIDALVEQVRLRLQTFKDFSDSLFPAELITNIERIYVHLAVQPDGSRRLNEPVTNAIINSAIRAAVDLLKGRLPDRPEPRLDRRQGIPDRLRQEKYSFRRIRKENGKYRLRAQSYHKAGIWQNEVIDYTDKGFDSLRDMFRSVDHSIDSAVKELQWLKETKETLERLQTYQAGQKEEMQKEIKGRLKKLKRVKVPEKRLARVILQQVHGMLDLPEEYFSRVRSLLSLAVEFLDLRVKEIEAIVRGTQTRRLSNMREEVNIRQRALSAKTKDVAEFLKQGKYWLIRKTLQDHILNPDDDAYLDPAEPKFNSLVNMLQKHLLPVLKKPRRSNADHEAIREAVSFLRGKVSIDEFLNEFMRAYRDLYIESYFANALLAREEAFRKTFEMFFNRTEPRYQKIKQFPHLYWAVFYLSSFVSRYAKRKAKGQPKKENPLFLALMNDILQKQVAAVGAKHLSDWLPQGKITLTAEEQAEFDKAMKWPGEDRAPPAPLSGRPTLIFEPFSAAFLLIGLWKIFGGSPWLQLAIKVSLIFFGIWMLERALRQEPRNILMRILDRLYLIYIEIIRILPYVFKPFTILRVITSPLSYLDKRLWKQAGKDPQQLVHLLLKKIKTEKYVKQEKVLVRSPRIKGHRRHLVLGDVQGDLKGVLIILGQLGIIDSETGDWRSDAPRDLDIVFLGDIIWRGSFSLATVWFINRLKKEAAVYGNRVMIGVGNHELIHASITFGFLEKRMMADFTPGKYDQLLRETLEDIKSGQRQV